MARRRNNRVGQQSGSKNVLESWLDVQHTALAKSGKGQVFKVPSPVVIESVKRGRVRGRLAPAVASDYSGVVSYGCDARGRRMGRSVAGEAKTSKRKYGLSIGHKHFKNHQKQHLQRAAELGAIVWIHFQHRREDKVHPDNYCVPVTAEGPAVIAWSDTYVSWSNLEPWLLPTGRSWVDCAVGLGDANGLFWEAFCEGGWSAVEAAHG